MRQSLATMLNNGTGVAALQNSCEEAAYSMEVIKVLKEILSYR